MIQAVVIEGAGIVKGPTKRLGRIKIAAVKKVVALIVFRYNLV